MPSSSSVSAACFMVAQSDWLPMMMATDFPAMKPLERRKKEAADYRGGLWGGKNDGPTAPNYHSWLAIGTGPNFANDESERSFAFAALHALWRSSGMGMGDFRHAP